ncbi:hypothetical protein C2G38_2253947 [Gigaspora rosea]|uniref:Uncharacterized protein n=1 Tax=Gigaspora rosea TaxID=44941 RepID=A0A397U4P6_9GLOM|nr:hypothetical protein C2G38_2253947 [Gigaspora rosea]
MEDSWTNPAFGPEYAESQNEGTYVKNAIAPAIRASLKDLPYESSSFVSTAERQSSTSADRKGEGDEADIHRYCHLRSVEIPVQFANADVVTDFVHTLLILRNIIITNISLLIHANNLRQFS